MNGAHLDGPRHWASVTLGVTPFALAAIALQSMWFIAGAPFGYAVVYIIGTEHYTERGITTDVVWGALIVAVIQAAFIAVLAGMIVLV